MSIRRSHLTSCGLVVAAVLLMSSRCWAIYHMLSPSKDDWGMKYDVAVSDTGGDMLTITYTLISEGRLKPFYSIELVAFSLETDSQGGRSYDVKAPIQLKQTPDGKRVGQVQVRKKFADRAQIRILTLTVDGKPQTQGAAYYDIPLKKYLDKIPAVASPPATKVTK